MSEVAKYTTPPIFRPEYPFWHECASAERPKHAAAAIEHWQARVAKHSKPGGCIGCLAEAERELDLWNKEKP